MKAGSEAYDVIIVGAGPSGATAAALLANRDHSVFLVDGMDPARTVIQPTWLSPWAKPVLEGAGVDVGHIFRKPISACTLFSADLEKSANPQIPAQPAFLVDRSDLRRSILKAFSDKGTGRFAPSVAVEGLSTRENGVVAQFVDGSKTSGKLLMLATGLDVGLHPALGLSASALARAGLWEASYQCQGPSAAEDEHSMDYVLGIGAGTGIGYRVVLSGVTSVGVCLPTSASAAVSELIRISDLFAQRGALPADWQSQAAGTGARWSPAGAALELESHVAKYSLVVGRAGGFVAGYTNEDLYPGMWSAQIAAEVVEQALLASQPQDRLREFERLWRTTMADHLRPPNTDAASLLPLVFSNKQMADKMLLSLQLGINL